MKKFVLAARTIGAVKSMSALAHQFESVDAAAEALGFSSVNELQHAFVGFCRQER